jgi:acyl carrier protein
MDANEELQKIFDELTEIIRDVFDNDTVVATPNLTASQVEGWDSLGNVRVLLSIENEYGIRFSAGEISSIKNVGELAEAIATKRK